MANTEIGSAYLSIIPSMKGFGTKVSEGVTSSLSGIGSTLKTAFVGTAAAATAAVAAIGAASLSAYADYEQLVGGVDTLFGSASGQLQKYAAQAYKTCGMSANQYMTQATSFAASLVSSCGGDVAQAAEFANTAMGDMADNVNKMGSSMEDVQNAYQGFAKQNYTMLDNLKLGYGGTKSEMERLIADANELKEAQGEVGDLTIDSYADIVEAIHTVQDEMGITGTTAKEAATTISGSIGMAQAAWQNFLVGLANEDADFSQLTEELLSSIGAVATNVAPRVAQIGAGIIAAFPGVLSGLADVLAPIVSDALASAWNIASSALSGLGIQLPSIDGSQVLAAFSVVESACGQLMGALGQLVQWFANLAAQIAPVVLPAFTSLGQTVMALAPYFMNLATTLGGLLAPAVSGIAQIVAAAVPIVASVASWLAPIVADVLTLATNIIAVLTPAITSVLATVQAVMPLVQAYISTALSVIQSVWNAVWPAIEAVYTAFWAVVSALVQATMAVVQTVISVALAAISGDWSGVWSAISSFFSGIWSTIQSIASSAIGAVGGFISSGLSTISSVWSAAWNSLKSFFTSIWNGLKNAAKSGVDGVVSTVKGIKDKIVNFFSGAGSWLVSSGQALLQGLADGISSKIGAVTSMVSGAVEQIRSWFPFSPAKVGPFSGHGYTTYSGKALMEGLAEGISKSASSPQSALSSALSSMQTALGVGAELTASYGASLYGQPASADPDGAAGSVTNVYLGNELLNVDGRVADAIDVLVGAINRTAAAGVR